jgi:hypothetical protein
MMTVRPESPTSRDDRPERRGGREAVVHVISVVDGSARVGSGLDRAAPQHHRSAGEGEETRSSGEEGHRRVGARTELATGVHLGRGGRAVAGRIAGRLEGHSWV